MEVEQQPPIIGLTDCYVGRHPFAFDPDCVVCIPIDPVSDLPPELGGDARRAVDQPVCAVHVMAANEVRARRGEPLLKVVPDSTTDWN